MFLLDLGDSIVWSDAATITAYIEQGVGDMQTKFGYALLLIVVAAAAILAWTGRLTGWFDPENIVSLNWGFLALGTILAIGVVKVVDRRHWVVIMLDRKARRDAQRQQIERRKAAVSGFWAEIMADSLDSIQEALCIGPYAPEDAPAIAEAPASATG